jgi:GNAT superfamily N-acetyltransferase
MEIVQSGHYEFVEVLYLTRVCIQHLNERGYKFWNHAYPSPDLLTDEINSGSIYMAKDKGVAKGMISLTTLPPEEYKDVEWSESGNNFLYIKWLMVHPHWENGDIQKHLLEFAVSHAKVNGLRGLRMDYYSGNDTLIGIIESEAFTKSGEFHSTFQKAPFYCFEKKI